MVVIEQKKRLSILRLGWPPHGLVYFLSFLVNVELVLFLGRGVALLHAMPATFGGLPHFFSFSSLRRASWLPSRLQAKIRYFRCLFPLLVPFSFSCPFSLSIVLDADWLNPPLYKGGGLDHVLSFFQRTTGSFLVPRALYVTVVWLPAARRCSLQCPGRSSLGIFS